MVEDKLNLKYYTGEDLYSDGDIEDELLEIVSNHETYEEILQNDNRWPILYHLSGIRQNILDWYEFGENATVLEIGAGCGAITGVLCEHAKKVTCIELSKKRSLINATRNRKYDNLEIFVGNFEDIQIEEKYDYVTLIGVLEYSPSYIKDLKPFHAMLRKIKKYLKPEGKVIIAIENKYGLKYLSGATEDHTGVLFDGITDYKNTHHVRTFTKPEINELLKECDYGAVQYYYPMPDYKMATVIYSDDFLPKQGDIRNVTNVYDRERYLLFNEEIVYDQLCKDELIDYFANSFLIIAEGV